MLDKLGFKKKTYADLIEEMELKSKELFGEKINLTPRSFLGILLRLFAWFLSQVWELAESVYYSAYPTKAGGVQLDRLTPFFMTSRNIDIAATVDLSFTGTPSYTILENTRFETSDGVEFYLTSDVVLDTNGFGTGTATCSIVGTIGKVDANTITVQSEPSADIFTVTNTLAATGGQNYEEDNVLLNRLLNSGASNGSGTINATIADILAISGVRAARNIVNNTDTEVNGQPPHSNQLFVFGGTGQEIANALMKNFTGIQFYGTSSFTVSDIAGNTHLVAYTPAVSVDIFSTITITSDNTFQSDGSDQVKNAVISVIGGLATDGTLYTGLNMDEDVILSRILAYVMNVQGVTDTTITIGTAVDTQGVTNIVINSNEVAQTDVNKISVVVS